MSAKDIAKETAKDRVLIKVRYFTQSGCPKHVDDVKLKPYWNRCEELIVKVNCVLWVLRVIIPLSLRPQLLAELHTEHMSMVKTKAVDKEPFLVAKPR